MSDTYLAQVLALVKARLNRLAADTSIDDYLTARIRGAFEELNGNGISIDETSTADLMLLVDFVVWRYSNRDKADSMPEWLRAEKRERWLRDQKAGEVCR